MRTAHCHLCDHKFRTTSEDDHLCGRCEDAVEPWEKHAHAEGYRQGLERAAQIVDDTDIETFRGFERQDDARSTLTNAAAAIRAEMEKKPHG